MRRWVALLLVLGLVFAALPVSAQESDPSQESTNEDSGSDEDVPPGAEFGKGKPALESTSSEAESSASGDVKTFDQELEDHVVGQPDPLVPPEEGVREDTAKSGSDAVFADLGLTVSVDSDSDRSVELVVPDADVAGDLSPFGLAFSVDVKDETEKTVDEPVVISFDYSDLASGRGGDLGDRLRLAWVEGCAPVDVEVGDPKAPDTVVKTRCESWTEIPSTNDRVGEVLTADLVTETDSFLGLDSSLQDGETGSESGQGPKAALSGPLAEGGSGGGFLTLLSSGSGPEGSFEATPLSTVSDYQVGLFTGSFDVTIPFAVPPAAAGQTPEAGLGYSSGSIDGLNSSSNNQASAIGLGWSLIGGGSIVRHSESCTTGDLCPTGHDYTLTLNGVTSRLVLEDDSNQNNIRFRLKSDPNWRVELKRSGNNDDADDEFWVVTTPDGTQYRFGYDSQSADHVPFYTYQHADPFSCQGKEIDPGEATHFCRKVWRWNLDRVLDTSGNEILYTYVQELNYYDARNHEFPDVGYVRDSHLREVAYTSNGSLEPSARILYLTELRCSDPEVKADCKDVADFPDTPVDLSCRMDDACTETAPSFYSERRVSDVITQVVEANTWRSVSWWDLFQLFPSPPEGSEPKLWLDRIRQRPGGAYAIPAFVQVEAEDRNVQSGTSIGEAADYGQGSVVQELSNGDWLRFRDVDFEDGIDMLLVRMSAAGVTGKLHFWMDAMSGPDGGAKIGVVNVSDTGGLNEFDTFTLGSFDNQPTGVHDVYVVVSNVSGGGNLGRFNWFRFTPSTGLSSLPPTEFEAEYLANRVWNNGVEPPMWMPRIDEMTNPLGGVIDVTYGQDHPWVYNGGNVECSSGYSGGNQHRECDFYVAWDPYTNGGEWWHWNKYKVKETTQSDPNTESAAVTLEYAYSKPTWHYSDVPGFNSHTGSTSLSCPVMPCNHWNDFRGHETVTVEDASGAKTKYFFYQGMDGDWEGTAGWTFEDVITLSDSTTREDHEWLAGQVAEVRVLKSGGGEIKRTVTEYYWTKNAGSVARGAYFTGPDDIREWVDQTAETRRELTYDAHGNTTEVNERGSTAVSWDNSFVQTVYNKNTSAWIVNTPKRVTVWDGDAAGSESDQLSQVKLYYDDHDLDTSPTTGLVTKRWDYTNVVGGDTVDETLYTYDVRGRLNKTTFAHGGSADNDYDGTYGFVSETTEENGANDITTGYDVDPGTGLPTTVTDVNGNQTVYAYDGYGRLSKVWQPTESESGTASWRFTYTNTAPVEVHTERLAVKADTTWLERWDYYDGWGRLIQTQTPSENGGSKRYVEASLYGDRNQLRRQSTVFEVNGAPGSGWFDPEWTGSSPSADLHTVYTYDALQRVTAAEVIADDSSPNILWDETWAYDGWDTTHTDPDGHSVDATSNAFGSVEEVVEHNGGSSYTTEYDYDPAGRLTGVTDHLNNTTTIGYDLKGQKTSMTDPDSGDWAYTYDGGLLKTQTSEEDTLWFGYDLLGRPTERRTGSASGPLYAAWTYDRTGYLGLLDYSESFSDGTSGSGSTGWRVRVTNTGYDARGRVTATRWEVREQPGSTWDHTYLMGFTYDTADRAKTVTYPGGDTGGSGETVTYEYKTSTGQPESLKDVGNTVYVAASSYTPQGAPVSQTRGAAGYANRVVREWSYFTDSLRLAQVKAKTIHEGNPTYDVARIDYWYTPGGNITERVDWRNSEQVECYEYDPLDRLTTAFTSDRDGLVGEDCSDGYVNTGAGPYDQAYTYTPIGNMKRASDWSYGGSGAGPHALTSIGTTTSFGYDQTGRQTTRTISGTTTTTTWTPSGMTDTLTTSGNTTTYIYTADDTLFARIDPAGALNVRIGEHWETDGTTTRTNYRYASSLIAVRTQTATTNTLTHIIDDTQTTTSVVHTLGGTTGRIWYDPWGLTRATTGTGSPTPHGYTSQHSEPSGLIDYHARQYDPTHGRFTSPDTIIADPTNPQDLNRYAYTRNNPTTMTDPSGHCASQSWDLENWAANISECASKLTSWADNTMNAVESNPVASTAVEFSGVNDFWKSMFGADFLTNQQVDSKEQAIARAGFLGSLLFGLSRLYKTFRYGDEAVGTALGMSRLVPGGGLSAHEAAGGHVLSRHVSQSVDQLAGRLASNPRIRSASTFPDRATAEASIAEVLQTNHDAIQRWLAKGGSSTFTATFGESVGTVLSRGAAGPIPASQVSVVLRPSSVFSFGFRIHTVFLDP